MRKFTAGQIVVANGSAFRVEGSHVELLNRGQAMAELLGATNDASVSWARVPQNLRNNHRAGMVTLNAGLAIGGLYGPYNDSDKSIDKACDVLRQTTSNCVGGLPRVLHL